MKLIVATMMLAMFSDNVAAEWVRIEENDRSIAYADTGIRSSGDVVEVWVLFDYKTIQSSPRSGRQYFSEKAQREIDCRSERERVLFFTWHIPEEKLLPGSRQVLPGVTQTHFGSSPAAKSDGLSARGEKTVCVALEGAVQSVKIQAGVDGMAG